MPKLPTNLVSDRDKTIKIGRREMGIGKTHRQLRKQCFPKPPGEGPESGDCVFIERNLRMFHIVYIGGKKRSAGRCQIGMYKIAFFSSRLTGYK